MGRKVIDLESRQRLKNRPQMLFFDRVAPTGARPALGGASDGQDYWVKFAQNDQGSETVVNEVVASIVGDSIGAPVAPWAIVEVPLGLKQILDGRLIVPGPAFGSRVIHLAEENRMPQGIPHVLSDGNINRIPLMVAMWELCNALDIQAVFDNGDDRKIYSIDHGFWFGSYPYPWKLSEKSMFPQIDHVPMPSREIPDDCWKQAEIALEGLNDEVIGRAVEIVPKEWGHEESEIERLVEFAIGRKDNARNQLRRFRKEVGK